MSKIYKQYLQNVRGFLQKKTNLGTLYTYTIQFCEDNNLIEDFVNCKMRLDAFYAYSKYKVGEITLDIFEKKIIPILNKKKQ